MKSFHLFDLKTSPQFVAINANILPENDTQLANIKVISAHYI